MSADLEALLKGLGETLERVAPALEKLSQRVDDAPAQAAAPIMQIQAQGIEDQAVAAPVQGRSILSFEDQLEVRSALRGRTNQELFKLFAYQSNQTGKGIPLDAWLYAGGAARQDLWGNAMGREITPEVQKLLDTGGAAPVIRQDLEPILYELFVREFPAFDMFAKEPANGLTHTYQQTTGYGDAKFMSELGTVTDDVSAYARQTTNVAIIATRRGVSLKSQFATIQSGSGFNPEQLEMTGGLRAIAHRMQSQIFSGHATDSGGDSTNELGEYDANAFTGLRSILNTGRVKNADPRAVSAPAGVLRTAWNQACVEIMQAGPGRPGVIFLNPWDKETFDAAQDQNIMYTNQPLVNVAVGVTTNTVNTIFGALPLFPIPGDAISAYTAISPAESVRDSYLLDMSSMSLPYLGSEGITTLEIPIGVSGQLTKLYIFFGMFGLAVKAPTYSNKVRINVA
jgi:hypothetical protein